MVNSYVLPLPRYVPLPTFLVPHTGWITVGFLTFSSVACALRAPYRCLRLHSSAFLPRLGALARARVSPASLVPFCYLPRLLVGSPH